MTETTDKQKTLKDLRYKLYHDLDQLYHRFFDEVAQTDLREGDAASLTQNILKARQDSLKYLVEDQEIKEYEQVFPEDEV